MTDISFAIVGNVMTRTDANIIYSGTVGQYRVVFRIEDDGDINWEGYYPTVQFIKYGQTMTQLLTAAMDDDGLYYWCVLPWEMCQYSADFDVSVFGADGNGNRITMANVTVEVTNSGQDAGNPTPTADIFDQIVAALNNRDLTEIVGYDATETQSLKNINGTLQWVTEGE